MLSALHRGKLHSNRAFQLEVCDQCSRNLKKEVKRAAMPFLLSFASSSFSNITNRQCCKLKPFRNPHWLEKCKLSKYLDSLLYINFSCNFERFVRILLICDLFCCTFKQRIKEKISKARKAIGIVKRLSNVLPRKQLISFCKFCVRLHLDSGDLIYDQPNNESLCQQIENFQYNAFFPVTGTIKGTSRLTFQDEIGLESFTFRRWFRIFCTLYII